jgi:hypothetical protein
MAGGMRSTRETATKARECRSAGVAGFAPVRANVRNGWKAQLCFRSNQTFGGLTKLDETLGEGRRNMPLAECCFELIDQGKQLFRDGLHLRCRRVRKVTYRFLIWGRAHRTDFPELTRAICNMMLALSFRLSSAVFLKSCASVSDSEQAA